MASITPRPSTTILPPSAISAAKEALACTLLGTVLSAAVYGISVLQAYIYFKGSSKDSTYMRTFVTILFLFDSISMATTIGGLYEYAVTDFGNPSAFLQVPGILAFEDGTQFVVGLLTQCFFAHSIWILSKRNVTVVSCIVIMALCSFGFGLALSVKIYVGSGDIFFLSSLEMRVLAGFANGLTAICDIAISATLCYYLHSKRTGFKRTDSMINLLIIYAINRGALTAICEAVVAITYSALPNRFIFIPFGLVGGRLYCNALLATLNAQKSMGRDGTHIVELGSQIFNESSATNRGNNRSQTGQSSGAGSGDSMPDFIMKIPNGKTDMGHISTVYRHV